LNIAWGEGCTGGLAKESLIKIQTSMKLFFTALTLFPLLTTAKVFLGGLVNRFHNVGGSVYALSNRVLEIRHYFVRWYRSGRLLVGGCGSRAVP